MVRKEIAESIKSCKYFSIPADEANDVILTEQLSIAIRFFDETSFTIEECFISFTPMLKLDAASITDYILNTLETQGSNYKSSLIGLGFDEASVMRGQLSGVQKCIRNNAPYAHYVHCYGHGLNLVLINATEHIPGAANSKIYIFS